MESIHLQGEQLFQNCFCIGPHVLEKKHTTELFLFKQLLNVDLECLKTCSSRCFCRTCFSMGDLGVQVSIRQFVFPSTFTLGVLWAQLLLQFCTVLNMFSSWYEDVHMIWM